MRGYTASKSAERIIIAEDDYEMRRLMVESLRRDNYSVEALEDGTAMLAAVEKARAVGQLPSLIICDIQMPGVTGLAVLATVRGWGWKAPFVLITAFGTERMITEAISLGASAVLSKPFGLDDFRTTVHCLLR
jgi:CheY-like chemotaxis protein